MRMFDHERTVIRPVHLPLTNRTGRFWKYEKKIGAIRKKYVMEDRQVREWCREMRQRGDTDQCRK
jgi:hypothetical protein